MVLSPVGIGKPKLTLEMQPSPRGACGLSALARPPREGAARSSRPPCVPRRGSARGQRTVLSGPGTRGVPSDLRGFHRLSLINFCNPPCLVQWPSTRGESVPTPRHWNVRRRLVVRTWGAGDARASSGQKSGCQHPATPRAAPSKNPWPKVPAVPSVGIWSLLHWTQSGHRVSERCAITNFFTCNRHSDKIDTKYINLVSVQGSVPLGDCAQSPAGRGSNRSRSRWGRARRTLGSKGGRASPQRAELQQRQRDGWAAAEGHTTRLAGEAGRVQTSSTDERPTLSGT